MIPSSDWGLKLRLKLIQNNTDLNIFNEDERHHDITFSVNILLSSVLGCLLLDDSFTSVVQWLRLTALLRTVLLDVISSVSRSRPGHAQIRSPITQRPRTAPAADSRVNTALTGRRVKFPTQLLLHMNR